MGQGHSESLLDSDLPSQCTTCGRPVVIEQNRKIKPPEERIHGWYWYKRGCRCDVCREANRIVVNRYRAKKTRQAYDEGTAAIRRTG